MEAEQKQQVRKGRTEWFVVFLCEAPKQDRTRYRESFDPPEQSEAICFGNRSASVASLKAVAPFS